MIDRVHIANPAELKRFAPLRNLPKRILDYVAGQSLIEQHNAGSTVTTCGSPAEQVYYLLEGQVELSGNGSDLQRFRAHTDRTVYPLASQNPCETTTKSTSAITTLRLPWELYDAICQLGPTTNASNSQSSDERDSDGPETAVFWKFYRAMEDRRVELPTLPHVAVRIAKVINASSSNSKDIAQVIQADPSVAARLMSVVNSAAYRGGSTIENLPDAVTRLGRSVTHNLVVSFALGNLFRTDSKALQQRMIGVWKHASYVAPICHELARATPGLSPDQALLCGLLHDIGAVPIISEARKYKALVGNPRLLDRLIDNLKAEVGAMILKKWQFPDAFVQAALHADDWMLDLGEQPDYVDLVLVAQLHSYIGTPEMAKLPRLDLVPAFHKLALGKLTPQHSLNILENARERVHELRELLTLDAGAAAR